MEVRRGHGLIARETFFGPASFSAAAVDRSVGFRGGSLDQPVWANESCGSIWPDQVDAIIGSFFLYRPLPSLQSL